MLRQIIPLSHGARPGAADGLGHAYGIYDFNGDGIGDILLGQPFRPFADDAVLTPADLLAMRDLIAIPGLVEEREGPAAPLAEPASAESEDLAPRLGGAALGADFAEPPAGPVYGNLAARFDGLVDLSADHFLF